MTVWDFFVGVLRDTDKLEEDASGERTVCRCRVCNAVVDFYLDHVGKCDVPGACPGTFSHPPRRCKMSGTLRHADVTYERVRVQRPAGSF